MSAAAVPVSASTPRAAGSANRLLSLDVFRGLTIAFMIMVNDPGGPGAWAQMNHADWNGFTATDLVFPTFLFVVGVSIVFAFQARLAHGASRASLARHTLLRAAILFALGIVINGFPDYQLEHLRIYGVLQRIAVCYLAVGLFYLWDRRASTKVFVLAALLLGYWILLRFVPVPGAGLPGRDVPFLDRDQNIVAWVDRQLMPGHLYEDLPSHNARDPEGLLSDIPAIATTLIGLLAGMGLRVSRSVRAKAGGLFVAAAVSLALGYLWSPWFPLNKKLWTSSYVLVAAGWSLFVFAMLYWLMESRGWFRSGWSRAFAWPCLVFGSNAILAYLISELLGSVLEMIRFPSGRHFTNPVAWADRHFFAHIYDPGWRVLAFSLTYTLVCFLPVWALYRKKIFFKI